MSFTTIEATDQYLVLFAVTMIFSLVAILYRERIANMISTSLSFICWVILGISHVAAGNQDSPLSSPLGYLYFFFSFVFLMLLFKNAFEMMKIQKQRKYGGGAM
jgi:CHASE2 domain-containing sensor protein